VGEYLDRPQWNPVNNYRCSASPNIPLGDDFLKLISFIKKIIMAKRSTGIEKGKTSHSKKTKKRLAIKKEMLAKKAAKRRK